jgi:hypothetical protein
MLTKGGWNHPGSKYITGNSDIDYYKYYSLQYEH